MNRSVLTIMLIGGLAIPGATRAQADPVVTVTESGVGSVQTEGGAPTSIVGVIAADPGPLGFPSALTYYLPAVNGLVPGDLLVRAGGSRIFTEVIRFNPATRATAASVVFYHIFVAGQNLLPADVGEPWDFYPNYKTVPETVYSGAKGYLYTPQPGDPGYLSNSNVTYNIVSDVTIAPATPPTVPTLNYASANGATEIDLIWTASAAATGVAGYEVFRNGSLAAVVGSPATIYADSGLPTNTTYTYSVEAIGAGGDFSALGNSLAATTGSNSAPLPQQSCTSPASGAFTGCYYNNTTLSGNPSLVRTDSQINFDWGSSTPDPSLTAHSFSVAWAGSFGFSAGSYSFSATVSDGIRVFIDGTIVMDHWVDQPVAMYTATVSLTQGIHLISVRYYDHTGPATAHLTWQPVTPAGLKPTILSFTASPAAVTWGQTSILSWQVNGATSITLDNGIGDMSSSQGLRIAPRQTTTYSLTASNSFGPATAQVTVTVGTGLDNQPPTPTTLVSAVANGSGEVDLTWTASSDNVGVAGYQITRNGVAFTTVSAATLTYPDTSVAPSTSYTYSITAYDAAGNFSVPNNSIQVTTPAALGPPPGGGNCTAEVNSFIGCYYNNLTLSGTPALSRTDSQINFDWGSGSPDRSIAAGNFSVRWQGYFTFNAAVYAFTADASDGIRLYIDGNLILNSWQDQPPTLIRTLPTMTPGIHLVTVEYYEHTGLATAHLTWVQF